MATQFGALRVVQDGSLLAEPALDLTEDLCTANEEGLLGATVDPAFTTNGFVYLYYTRDKSGTCVNRVSRFTMSGSTIAPASEAVLIDEIPATGNHNAGDLRFGNDGYLYVSVGDGGCDWAGDSGCAGQNDAARDRHVLVGKILRITSTGGIPPANPFQGAGTARCNVTGRTTAGNICQETFAWGLRNPFRFAFDPNSAATRFFINDVGQGAWEEIDEGLAGADYGWNVREGPCANGSLTNCGPPPAGMTNPVYAYSHPESGCHAITGGAFVPDGVWPASFDGAYLFGDYTCGKIFLLTRNGGGGFTRTEFTDDVGAVVNMTFGPSPQGQGLYYTNYTNGGQVRRIESTASVNRPPTARMTATPRSGAVPLAVSFDASASSDPDPGDTLSYSWNFGDGSPPLTTTGPVTSHSYGVAGTYTATLVVRDDHDAASPATTARIDPGNTPPHVTIDAPTTAQRFAVGETITLSATANDAEDGALAPANLSWRVLRRHDAHTHPFLAPTAGNGLEITQPAPEDLGSGIDGYLELQVTATDSAGVTTTVTRNVQPRKVDLTFASDPGGRELVLGGVPYAAPTTLTSWEGHTIHVEARPQTDASGSWSFQSWSDGGAAAHSIVSPAVATTYTATFVRNAVSPSLVAAYSFGEGSGSAVADGSGRGNVGVVSGAGWSVAGRFGSALSFDGVNDWVTVADAGSLDLSSALTVEAWVRPSRLGGWRTVAFKERPGGVVYGLYGDQAGGRPLGQVFIGGERNAVGSASLPLNVWSHLATTFDGSVVRLYVNGALAGSSSVSGAMAASSGPLRIGGNSVWGEWFAGLIDEVRVYNRALSAAEIQQDLQTPVGASPPSTDTSPPTAPSGVSASPTAGAVSLWWDPSGDNVGVVRYNVHRSQTGGFTPSPANRIGQPAGTTHADSGLAAGTYFYRVLAEDAAGNLSPSSTEVAAAVPPNEPPPPTTGLVAAYSFAAGSGPTVADASGRGNAGSISGAVWSGAGRFGSALSFDGVNDWVTVPDAASLDLTSGLTVEAWVRPSRLGGWRTVVFKERPGGVVYGLYGDQAGGRPLGQVFIGGERNAVGSSSLPLSAWSHLASTFDGSVVRLYVNGALAGSSAVAGAMGASSGPLRIGGNSVWAEWFAGLIDEVRVYNRALSPAEIQQDLQTPVG